MRNREAKTPFARALWRLGLTIPQAEARFRVLVATLKRWSAGRTEAPRYAWRLLAYYRLTTWRTRSQDR